MKVVVSFTSYPPRIGSVHKVVESLYRQTVKADEIVLYLSMDEFPRREADLPETLRRLDGQEGFRIAWVCGNLKSHKKYYYALQEYKDAVVITVDDDKIYAETMICDLMKSYERFPDAVSARSVRIMLRKPERLEPYCRWETGAYLEEYADAPRMDLCAIGAGGICYPVSLVKEEWFHEETITDTADNCDDLWLKYNEIIRNIPVVYTKPLQEDVTIENSQFFRLADNNLYGCGNDTCICELLMLLKARDANHYQTWFRKLMTREKYIKEKKKYYAGVFTSAFEKAGNVPIYFYGAGKRAQHFLMILTDLRLTQRITAIIVSNRSGNPASLYGLQVRSLSEINTDSEFAVILGVGEANRKEIMDRLAGYDHRKIELDMRVIMRCYQC